MPIFQSALEWSNFCNSSCSCERHFEIWPALCADLLCSSSSFQVVVLCNFCCGLWCNLLGIIREVVWVSAWREECGSSERLLLRRGRRDAWKMEEPRWLQPWVLKDWGETFSNFIYYLRDSVLCRKEKKGEEEKGNIKRWSSFHNEKVAKLLKIL